MNPKPDDIPDDAWQAADVGLVQLSRMQEIVARAIMVERERCVDILQTLASSIGRTPPADEQQFAVENAIYATLNMAQVAIRRGDIP